MLPEWLKSIDHGNFQFDHPYQEMPLILVSGLGRSGTTILRKCVAAHPDIDCTDKESNIIHDLTKIGYLSLAQKDRQINLAVDKKNYWLLFRNMILHMHWPVKRIKRATPPVAISTYSAMSRNAGFGLAKAFPKHRIFLVFRNGIEVVASHCNFKAFKDTPFRDICALWQINTDMVHFGEDHGNVVLFRHEWFHDEEKTADGLRAVFDELGLSFDESCAKVAQNRNLHPTKHPNESRSDFNDRQKRADRWKYWTDEQRAIFVEECAEGMKYLGYDIPWL